MHACMHVSRWNMWFLLKMYAPDILHFILDIALDVQYVSDTFHFILHITQYISQYILQITPWRWNNWFLFHFSCSPRMYTQTQTHTDTQTHRHVCMYAYT